VCVCVQLAYRYLKVLARDQEGHTDLETTEAEGGLGTDVITCPWA
jgi:hypothetical protein